MKLQILQASGSFPALHDTPARRSFAHRGSSGPIVVYGRLSSYLFAIGVLFASATSLPAADKDDIDILLTAQRVKTDVEGKEHLDDGAITAPGEVVLYRAVFLNTGTKTLRDVQPSLPIPPGMEYVPASAMPELFAASVDGKNFAPIPLILERKIERGVELIIEVQPVAYRALRWPPVHLAPGESVTVAARVRVIEVR